MEQIKSAVITDYGYDGEGVSRINGKVVFVPHALEGERVKVKIKDDRSSFCTAKLIDVELASELRETPPCPYFSKCGGCSYQHTTYENELKIKADLLRRQLDKVGYDGEIELYPSGNCYSYRNKIRLFVGERGLGLKERKSSYICHIDSCMIAKKEINRAFEIINTFILAGNHQRHYSEVVLRQEGQTLLVNLYKTTKANINYQGLYLMLGGNFGIFETYRGETTHKIGRKIMECEEFGLKCHFSPLSFHQVNDEVGRKLYQRVIDNLQGKNVLNCYSGAGVLSGIIALQNKRVVGVELGKAEHMDAEFLKETNNLFYLTNINGDCAAVLPRLSEKFDTVVVDPPRNGISDKVAKAINDLSFKRFIYISCNSATLVRDLARLKGLKFKKVMLFDMFARTGEYESVVVLDKK